MNQKFWLSQSTKYHNSTVTSRIINITSYSKYVALQLETFYANVFSSDLHDFNSLFCNANHMHAWRVFDNVTGGIRSLWPLYSILIHRFSWLEYIIQYSSNFIDLLSVYYINSKYFNPRIIFFKFSLYC